MDIDIALKMDSPRGWTNKLPSSHNDANEAGMLPLRHSAPSCETCSKKHLIPACLVWLIVKDSVHRSVTVFDPQVSNSSSKAFDFHQTADLPYPKLSRSFIKVLSLHQTAHHPCKDSRWTVIVHVQPLYTTFINAYLICAA